MGFQMDQIELGQLCVWGGGGSLSFTLEVECKGVLKYARKRFKSFMQFGLDKEEKMVVQKPVITFTKQTNLQTVETKIYLFN